MPEHIPIYNCDEKISLQLTTDESNREKNVKKFNEMEKNKDHDKNIHPAHGIDVHNKIANQNSD